MNKNWYVRVYKRSSFSAESSINNFVGDMYIWGQKWSICILGCLTQAPKIFKLTAFFWRSLCRLTPCPEKAPIWGWSICIWCNTWDVSVHFAVKQERKKNATKKEHVSPRWFMAWFTVPWIRQPEACYVFSRLWLRWVHFKLPNRRQCSSKLGQMESGRHSRDDSGSRWALPALFGEGSGRIQSWHPVGGCLCSTWIAWMEILGREQKERGRERSERKAGWNVQN